LGRPEVLVIDRPVLDRIVQHISTPDELVSKQKLPLDIARVRLKWQERRQNLGFAFRPSASPGYRCSIDRRFALCSMTPIPSFCKAQGNTLMSNNWFLFKAQLYHRVMRGFPWNKPRGARKLALVALVAFLIQMPGNGAPPDVVTIIRNSVAANQRDWDAAPAYAFKETDRDRNGSKTYQISMIAGSPFQELIAVNGKPPPGGEQAKQAELQRQAIATHQTETSAEKERRIEAYVSGRRRDHVLMTQLTDAFNFTLVGERTLNGFGVYLLNATPRSGYRPPNLESQVLPGMHGQLWIDRTTFQWVKVTARVIRPVSIEGILAQVQPGTFFQLEKKPLTGDIWLPSHFVMRSHSRILFLIGHDTQANEIYFDYRKAEN
jgi:hypothetical protein